MAAVSKTNGKIEMKVFPKGQVVIPVLLRKKYNIDIGDNIEVVPSEDGILLKPLSKEKKTKSVTDGLFGIFEEYAVKRRKITKADILKASENGFSEGWKK